MVGIIDKAVGKEIAAGDMTLFSDKPGPVELEVAALPLRLLIWCCWASEGTSM